MGKTPLGDDAVRDRWTRTGSSTIAKISFGGPRNARHDPQGHPDSGPGASAVEYGLLVAAIAALVVIIVFSLGSVVQNVFKDTCTKIDRSTTDCKTK
jgi:pilus assembly protein Flp/PilA